MDNLIIALRAGQLFAHAAHNLVNGPNFFGDHGFFGDTYEALEGDYDSVVESQLANEEKVDLASLNVKAAELSARYLEDTETEALFESQAAIEHYIRAVVKKEVGSQDDAGQSLLQAIAERSLVRTYKINARRGK